MTSAPHSRRLPGDPAATSPLQRMLRVDHAGEYGAKRIYAGQLAVLKNHPQAEEIRHMAAQEEVHLATFDKLLPEHGARPSLLMPFWHVAGYALGAASALLGYRAAMATTVAVESVITEHYTRQLATPEIKNTALEQTLTRFRDEEQEHHDLGLLHEAEQAPFYHAINGLVRAGCRLAIRLAEKI